MAPTAIDERALDKLCDWISHARSAVFFGGAGVSTESGVPDFRSKDGLYNQHDVRFDSYRPEYLLSRSCLVDEPEVFFEFYRQKMDTRNIQPNAAHKFLADLEKKGMLKAVVTQNIDGLHQKAGSKAVYEIHGTTMRNYCMRCGKTYGESFIYDYPGSVPHCSCGGIVRCDVTLYEEALPEDAVQNAVHAIRQADLLIIGGTSLTVYPAASYIRYFRGDHIVVINKEHLYLQLDPENDLEINSPIGALFAEAAKKLGL
ncbi:MAG: NAD-dependent protein deacylase [Clostridia bacterium]|nr:NAD-dependent protein deacylase [Clostridia bacterium]